MTSHAGHHAEPPAGGSTRGCRGSSAVTQGVRVDVLPEYVAEQSDPESRQFLFTYRIRVSNTGPAAVQLRERHWIIVDAHGERDEVRGPGVVGQQPVLPAGQSFEYSSFVQLRTAWGTMEGEFLMVREDGERFAATVGRFFLVAPGSGGGRS